MIDQKRLKEALKYYPETGLFTWVIKRKGIPFLGIAGTTAAYPANYVKISVDCRAYGAHRLAFLYMTGRWPLETVDHINLVKNDNRWANLREATRSQNQVNHPVHRDSKSGIKGVYASQQVGKWCAVIAKKSRNIHLGTFRTKEEAAHAYKAKAVEMYGEFARQDAVP